MRQDGSRASPHNFQLVGQVDHRRHRVNGRRFWRACFLIPRACSKWGLMQWYALVMTAGLVGFVFYYVYH